MRFTTSLMPWLALALPITASAIPSERIPHRHGQRDILPRLANEHRDAIPHNQQEDLELPTPTADLLPRVAQACTTATAVSVTFNELVSTVYGESIVLVGSIPDLGNWDPSKGVALQANGYTTSNPLWSATVNLAVGTSLQYKYVRINLDGSFSWEADPNHSYTVPSGCDTTATESDAWQSVRSSTSIAVSTPTSALVRVITTTSTTSTATSMKTTSTSAVCTNAPESRKCWSDGFNVDTDFDNNWPNTGKTVSYSFDITNMTLAPDGYSRMVLAINGQYPGPTIYADWGDTIQVSVTNNMPDNGTAIHWHGLRQFHNNLHDGVPGVTECALAPGQSKTYTFQATQYGTSWYHSHFSAQYGDGVLGPIVIHGPATANYDIDLGPLPITDWYYPTVALHASKAEHEIALAPTADNALINGTMTSTYGGAYANVTLTAGKKHRLRVVNTAIDNHFMFGLDGHNMTVIANDFVPIVPYNASWVFIGIGQRYDVIINANQAPGAYWFRTEVQNTAGCGDNFNNGNIKAIFAYAGHESETPTSSKTSYTQRCTDETELVPHWNSYVPPASTPSFTDLDIAINSSTQADGSINVHWQVNDTPLLVNWSMPTVQYVRDGNSNYPTHANVIQLPSEGQWTYWVITQGSGIPYNVQVPHPIHLHGHDFFVLGAGSSAWSTTNAQDLNYQNPPRRDVAMLPSNGWLALAFITDNPGAWIMHCHIAWHADEGFAVQFLESNSTMQSIQAPGAAFDTECAAWSDFYTQKSYYLQGDSGI